MVQAFSVEQGLTQHKQPWSELFQEVLMMEGITSAADVLGPTQPVGVGAGTVSP
jgi:hypothetical protein